MGVGRLSREEAGGRIEIISTLLYICLGALREEENIISDWVLTMVVVMSALGGARLLRTGTRTARFAFVIVVWHVVLR